MSRQVTVYLSDTASAPRSTILSYGNVSCSASTNVNIPMNTIRAMRTIRRARGPRWICGRRISASLLVRRCARPAAFRLVLVLLLRVGRDLEVDVELVLRLEVTAHIDVGDRDVLRAGLDLLEERLEL